MTTQALSSAETPPAKHHLRELFGPFPALSTGEGRITLALIALAALVPLGLTLSTYGIVLFSIAWLTSGGWSERLARLGKRNLVWLFTSYYLFFWVGMLYTENTAAGEFALVQKLSLLLLPIMLASLPPLRSFHYIIMAFITGTAGFSLFALGRAVMRWPELGGKGFYYTELIGFAASHPSYFGLFAFTAVFLLAYYLVIYRSGNGIRVLFASLILLLLVFVFLLSARTEIVAFLLVANAALLGMALRRWKAWKVVLGILVLNGLALSLINTIPYTRYRFKLLFQYNQVDYWNSTKSRIEIWKASRQLIAAAPLTGYGTGDAGDELVGQYRRNGFQIGVDNTYNAHNQYFQAWLSTGIVGFLLLLVGLLLPMAISLRRKYWLYLVLLTFWALSFATESMLERQMGIVFYALMNSLFAFHFGGKDSKAPISDKD